MAKLNQILAIEKQTKQSAYEQVTGIHQMTQKDQLLQGISRTYKPLTEEGEKFPAENNAVQVRVEQSLKAVATALTPLFDVTLTRDTANCSAKSDVVVDGKVLLKSVPATYLLWLEKQLVDLHTIIVKLPTLPQSDTWKYSDQQECFATDAVETAKTKKIPSAFVKAPATEHHPAQVDVVHDDRVQGYWSTIKYSGALPRERAQLLRDRIEKLMAAVKFAREEANSTEAAKQFAGEQVFDFLFAS